MHPTRTLTALSLAAVLAACSAGTDREPLTARVAATALRDAPVADAGMAVAARAASPSAAAAKRTAPLIDADGRVVASDPATVPDDAAARTTAGLYASTEQAKALEASMGDRVVAFDVGCCNGDADLAVLLVYAQQAAMDLDNAVPVLLRGADRRMAAAVANRLLANGFTRVWVVAA